MEAIPALLLFASIQLALAGAGWWVAATKLRLSRAAAMHWSAFCWLGLLAAAAGLVEAGPRQAVPIGVSNLALAGAFLAVVRGTSVFLGRRVLRWPDGLALALVALVSLLDATHGIEPPLRSLLVSGVLAAVLLRGGLLHARPVRAEFGTGLSLLVSGPMLAAAALFGWHCVRAAWLPVPEDQLLMTAPTRTNVAVLLALTSLVTLFNLSLACMLVVRLVRRLQHLSRHDGLTKLLNRRVLMTLLEAEQRRMRRGGVAWALLLIDVDHFKRVNDQHGHAAGDEVLCRVATVLQHSAREVDTVARMGGEEFCVLAPLTDLHGAALLAERLRRAVAESASGPGAVAVTISVGVALGHPEPEGAPETAEAALARADVALYRAKAAGRDRVELPADGTAEPAPREALAVD